MYRLVTLLFVSSLVLAAFYTQSGASDGMQQVKPLESYGRVQGFRFTASSGEVLSYEELRGKVVVINFFFSRCGGICPTLNGNVKRAATTFANLTDVQFVSISVDPEYDTLARLTHYRESFKAPKNWAFVRGTKEDVRSFLGTQLKLVSGDEPDMHSTRVVLLDQEGDIRGYYRGLEPESIQELIDGIKSLLS